MSLLKNLANFLFPASAEDHTTSQSTPWYRRSSEPAPLASVAESKPELPPEPKFKPDDIVINHIPLGSYPTTIGNYKNGDDEDTTGYIANLYLPPNCKPFYLFGKLVSPREDAVKIDGASDESSLVSKFERMSRVIDKDGKESWKYPHLTKVHIAGNDGVAHRGWEARTSVYVSSEIPENRHERCRYTSRIDGSLVGEDGITDRIPSFLLLHADAKEGITIKNIYTDEITKISNSNPDRQPLVTFTEPQQP